MNIFNDKLSKMKIGENVRLTQYNGQTFEGTVVQNDGSDALTIQINSTVTLRYSQISSIENNKKNTVALNTSNISKSVIENFGTQEISDISNISNNNISKPAINFISEDEIKIECNDKIIKKVYKEIASKDIKDSLNDNYNKLLNAIKNHDKEKQYDETNNIWDIIRNTGYDQLPETNKFYAYVCLADKDYKNAADSFFYANELRDAYVSAFYGVKQNEKAKKDNNNKELYKLSAVFAAIYIAEENIEYEDEALTVLTIASDECNDISGFEYIISHEISEETKEKLKLFVENLFFYKKINSRRCAKNIDKIIEKLKKYYKSENIISEIKLYNEEDIENNAQSSVFLSVPDESDISDDDWHEGAITKYDFFEHRGIITDSKTQKNFKFELDDIDNEVIKNRVEKMSSDKFKIYYVIFKISKRASEEYAVNINNSMKYEQEKRLKAQQAQQYNFNNITDDSKRLSLANHLYTDGNYDDALKEYKDILENSDDDFEDVFSQIISCYLAIWNKKGELDGADKLYLKEMIDKYKDNLTKNKSIDSLIQYNIKNQNYADAISLIIRQFDSCDANNFDKKRYYLILEKDCYKRMEDYQSAISVLKNWLEIINKNHLNKFYTSRQQIYLEIVSLYLELDDYDNAEKYLNKVSSKEAGKQELQDKINAHKHPENIENNNSEYIDDYEYIDNIDNIDSKDDDLGSITIDEAYNEYHDNGTPDITDEKLVAKLKIFDRNHLYCLLTYCVAAEQEAKNLPEDEKSIIDNEFTMTEAIKIIADAFGYAYQNPLIECDYTTVNIETIFGNAAKIIPQYSDDLIVAASLRTFFDLPNAQTDYVTDDLIRNAANKRVKVKYPEFENLLNNMKSFYEQTGYSFGAFAEYKTNLGIIKNITDEAKNLCESIDSKISTHERYIRTSRMRELMFADNSEIRKALNIVAENKTNKFESVQEYIKNNFIRNNKPISGENADSKKIDEFIDEYWDKARDEILSEGKYVTNQHDKLKGAKRTSTINLIKKIITCICNWLAVAEHADNKPYINDIYDKFKKQILTEIEEINKISSDEINNNFNWGAYSVYETTEEFISQINGNYDINTRKYMFIDFLLGEDILLNDNYLPELNSTFCGFGSIDILNRIENHAVSENLKFEERITQIFSNDETKHNFRSARLIKEYAEDTGNTTLAESKEFSQFNIYLNQAKQRFKSSYQDFSGDIELYESRGVISDINGEKKLILKLALDWYNITRLTSDYGFYIKLLRFIENYISENAAKTRGVELSKQLDELINKPEYNFGVYSEQQIRDLIDNQNYISAEGILNCIRRNDTSEVYDYSIEPHEYFSEFITENSTDFTVVHDAGKKITDLILKYYGKKDLEKILLSITRNAHKEVRGGVSLLENWIKISPKDFTLLNKLGFDVANIEPEENSYGIQSYKVLCNKRKGKVTYPHCIPAFGSLTETEGFRVACLYGKYDCDSLISTFGKLNATPRHTIIFLDFALSIVERRKLARKIKKEKSLSKAFIVIDRVTVFYLAKHYSTETIAKRLMAVTLPFSYYQPFVEASYQTMPAELFTGREAELASIESPDGANLVYGGRQLGKSALLKMARHNVDGNANNDRAILLDVQYKNYKEVAKLVSRELITKGILDESCECDNWDDLAIHIEKRLMDENPKTRINYLLIMLDEADEFIKTSSEDNNPPITATRNLPAGRFKLVMAGLHNLSRFNREMLQGNSNLIHLSSIVVKQFKRSEAIKLLTNTLAYLGFRFNKEVISQILASTNYYPGLIQFYCQKLIEAMRDDDYAGYNEMKTPYYDVSNSHIKKILIDSEFTNKVNEKLEASLFTEEKGHSRYHIIALIFAYLYYDMPETRKYTYEDLMKVANEFNIKKITELDKRQVEELLNEMWDLNILSKEDEFYRFATEGFRTLLGSSEQVVTAMGDYMEDTGDEI